MYDVITIGSATRDVFMMSRALHTHGARDVLSHIEACLPFGAKINIDEIHFETGGGATNNAVTFSRLGKMLTAALTRVGADGAGGEIIKVLEKEDVDTEFVQETKEENTAYSTILSPGGGVGERTILVYRGASSHIEHERINWPKLKTRWFYISSLSGDLDLLKKFISHAKKIKAQLAFNPGGAELKKAKKVKSLFGQLSFLILNREEAAGLTGVTFENTKGLLRALRDFAPRALMTDGPKGAYAVTATAAYYIPSVGHKPKNITGAGDAFGSGFVTGWIKSNGNMETALRLASFNADSVVQHVGAKVGILRRPLSPREMKKLPIKVLKI